MLRLLKANWLQHMSEYKYSVSLHPSMYFLTTKYIIYFLYLPHYKRLNILVLYDDSLVQGLEGKANVESNLNSILSYSQYWMRHTTLEIKFELKMESHHMAGTNIKQESLDANWFYGANSATEFIDSNHGNFSTDPFNPFPFNIVITMWYDNQSNTSGAYRGAWGHPMPWVFCPNGFNPGGSSFLRFLGPNDGGLETTSKLFVKHLAYMLGAEGENSQNFRAAIMMT